MPDDRQIDGHTIGEWKEMAETAERMQGVAEGHVSSLEAHIRAVRRVAGAHDPTCNGCKTILDIVDGKINIFANQDT